MIIDGQLHCECRDCKKRKQIIKDGLCQVCLDVKDYKKRTETK